MFEIVGATSTVLRRSPSASGVIGAVGNLPNCGSSPSSGTRLFPTEPLCMHPPARADAFKAVRYRPAKVGIVSARFRKSPFRVVKSLFSMNAI